MSIGNVYLVGAGPGDPGLITVRGLECLWKADLVLYDGLVNPLLLRHATGVCERTCRSEAPQDRDVHQQDINARLIAAAKQGKTVVRLKGGDPFVFGRGGEEAAALTAAGVPFEVVPGVTAAVAASAYAGISVTHREFASAVAFITGHEDPHKEGSALDYDILAKFPGTLVFYMGLHRLPMIVESLVATGKPAGTPAAVISRGTTPAQITVMGPLAELPSKVAEAKLHAPSMIIIGDCVRQRDTIAWFEKRPLFGLRIGVTRTMEQSGTVVAHLLALGAQPVIMPTILIEPPESWREMDETLARLHEFDWLVFTSVNGVRHLLQRLWNTRGDMRRLNSIKLAAIGEGTAAALEDFHLRADVVPTEFRAEALAAAMQSQVQGKRVLWARASRGRDVLPAALHAAGASVEELVVYRNLDVDQFPPETLSLIERGELDWIGLSSPSIARNLRRLLSPAALSQIGKTVKLASISPVTTAAAVEAGLPVACEASVYTWDGILSAIGNCKLQIAK